MGRTLVRACTLPSVSLCVNVKYLEIEVFLEDGGEAVPLEEAALLHQLLPVLRHRGQVQLKGHVKT